MNITKEQHAAVAARIDALMPWETAWGSTVVIAIVQGNDFVVFGSGTLLKIADEHLLITASHVIELAGAKNLFIVVADRKTKEDLIPLEGEAILGNERIDVAVLQLKPSVVARLQESDFLRLDHFCTDEKLSEAMFAVVGFPVVMSEHKGGILSFTKFFHVAPSFAGDTSPFDDYDAKIHFLIEANLDETKKMDGSPMEFKAKDGQPAKFPEHLGGISGGSVWKIADSPEDSARRQLGSGKLVGVETGVYSDYSCMRATRWGVVIQMLKKALPDLRRPIGLWRSN